MILPLNGIVTSGFIGLGEIRCSEMHWMGNYLGAPCVDTGPNGKNRLVAPYSGPPQWLPFLLACFNSVKRNLTISFSFRFLSFSFSFPTRSLYHNQPVWLCHSFDQNVEQRSSHAPLFSIFIKNNLDARVFRHYPDILDIWQFDSLLNQELWTWPTQIPSIQTQPLKSSDWFRRRSGSFS